MRKKTQEVYEKVLIEFARIAATQVEKVSKVIIRKIKLKKTHVIIILNCFSLISKYKLKKGLKIWIKEIMY